MPLDKDSARDGLAGPALGGLYALALDWVLSWDFVRGVWWCHVRIGRLLVRLVTLGKVRLTDEDDVLAGCLGLLTTALVIIAVFVLRQEPQ